MEVNKPRGRGRPRKHALTQKENNPHSTTLLTWEEAKRSKMKNHAETEREDIIIKEEPVTPPLENQDVSEFRQERQPLANIQVPENASESVNPTAAIPMGPSTSHRVTTIPMGPSISYQGSNAPAIPTVPPASNFHASPCYIFSQAHLSPLYSTESGTGAEAEQFLDGLCNGQDAPPEGFGQAAEGVAPRVIVTRVPNTGQFKGPIPKFLISSKVVSDDLVIRVLRSDRKPEALKKYLLEAESGLYYTGIPLWENLNSFVCIKAVIFFRMEGNKKIFKCSSCFDDRSGILLVILLEVSEMESESDTDSFSDSSDDGHAPRGLNQELRARRLYLRENFNPFNCPAAFFHHHYRMSQELAAGLLNLIRDDFDVAQRRTHIPVHLKFCIALRMYASGGYQIMVAQDHFHATSQTTVSRIMDRFTESLLTLAVRLIYFPRTREERQTIQEGFEAFTRIPGILGMIDGTIIKLLRPTENEEAFYSFKHNERSNHHRFLIRSIRVCAGSNTDRFIWNNSHVKRHLEELRGDFNVLVTEGPYYLIGDKGYSSSPIMLTPIVGPVPGTPEAFYNEDICSTRSRQEQLNGKVVNKWRILKRERAPRYSPVKTAKIITGCAILHNYIILNGEIADEIIAEVPFHRDMLINFDNAAGEREREYIIRRYFSASFDSLCTRHSPLENSSR